MKENSLPLCLLLLCARSLSPLPLTESDFPCKLLESLLPASHFDLREDISLCLLGAGEEHLGDLEISSPCGLGDGLYLIQAAAAKPSLIHVKWLEQHLYGFLPAAAF